ncbi:unnamed protein product [Symbiodinium natans]|uniref:Uncharacterized protein n=1 Tax=Symbiodinium natans TaxID=878477 RepID=A0A812TEL0_9DINO|nr:unnamed protein product [Symbiodinium natans]
MARRRRPQRHPGVERCEAARWRRKSPTTNKPLQEKMTPREHEKDGCGAHLPVSFYLAEEAAQHQKGGKRKTSLGGDSACSESNESNQSIATANSDASTCLPDDHIVQLQTELSKCQRSKCKIDQLLSENDLLRKECHDSNCRLQVEMSLRKLQCRKLQISNKRLQEECQDAKQHRKEAADLNAALQRKLQLAETRLKEKLCPTSAAPFCLDAAGEAQQEHEKILRQSEEAKKKAYAEQEQILREAEEAKQKAAQAKARKEAEEKRQQQARQKAKEEAEKLQAAQAKARKEAEEKRQQERATSRAATAELYAMCERILGAGFRRRQTLSELEAAARADAENGICTLQQALAVRLALNFESTPNDILLSPWAEMNESSRFSNREEYDPALPPGQVQLGPALVVIVMAKQAAWRAGCRQTLDVKEVAGLEDVWRDSEKARSPTGLRTVQVGKMECGQFVGKIKPDKDVEQMARNFKLDDSATSRLTELKVWRKRRGQEDRATKDLERIGYHLRFAKRPNALCTLLVGKLLEGEVEELPDLTNAEKIMTDYKLDEDACSKMREIIEKRHKDEDLVLTSVRKHLSNASNASSMPQGRRTAEPMRLRASSCAMACVASAVADFFGFTGTTEVWPPTSRSLKPPCDGKKLSSQCSARS